MGLDVRACHDPHTSVGELGGDRLGRLLAEDAKRRVLGGDDRQLGIVDAHAPDLPRGHQRELIGRQRPRNLGRHHEGDLADVALLEIPQQSSEGIGVTLGPPGQRLFERDLGLAASGDEQCLEAERLTLDRGDQTFVGVDAIERSADEADAQVARELRKGVPVHASHRERLGHRQRAVDEILLRTEERDVHAIGRHVGQRQQRFQSGDASTGDEHAKRGIVGLGGGVGDHAAP